LGPISRRFEVQLALVRLQRALRRKYRPDQPRVPAGNPDRGQWTDRDGSTVDVDVTGSTDSEPEARLILAGGFTKDDLNLTVEDFIAQNCEGRIRRELPSQFLGSTIGEVMGAARSGDAAARKCLKLLREDRFRK
jgi:hypothetical protein